ncbi:hypothetical protein QIS99_03160 [Streptomyces sp. B-S-A8]|uniref:Prokaryotic metallothionein n=1 Tax=Streptomyces solicavernae TaxID=3043614 RepID=A0ABT6RLB6_9ACTN|nr:hypothetical protein [Streptomyces sp. B-S-A8]MDI3385221.1 hypothetical protein [Streptomyces sp. B-S-A8]
MGICDVCGNDYELTFEVRHQKETYVFDSLECAAERIAPTCSHCGCRILGHGVQAESQIYCCAHCARLQGQRGLVDHQ